MLSSGLVVHPEGGKKCVSFGRKFRLHLKKQPHNRPVPPLLLRVHFPLIRVIMSVTLTLYHPGNATSRPISAVKQDRALSSTVVGDHTEITKGDVHHVLWIILEVGAAYCPLHAWPSIALFLGFVHAFLYSNNSTKQYAHHIVRAKP